MNNQSFLDKILELVREGSLEKAIIELNYNVNSIEAMNFSAKMNDLNRKIRNAIISDENSALERNRIQYSLINYCESLRYGPNPTAQNFNLDLFDKLSDGNVVVETNKIEIEIKINRDFKTYSNEDQEKLLHAIANFLELNSNITIKNMKEGSVILSLELTPEQGEKLSLAIMSGVFSEFDVVDSKIKYDYPAYYSNLKSSESDTSSTSYDPSDYSGLLQITIVKLALNEVSTLLENMSLSKRKDLIKKMSPVTIQKILTEPLALSVTREKVAEVLLSNRRMGRKLTISEIMKESTLESRKLVVDVINELLAVGLVEKIKEVGKTLWQINEKGEEILKKGIWGE